MTKKFLITGTDTSIGKTYVILRMLEALKQQGFSTAAIKPISSGCEITTEGLQNEDAILLRQTATLQLPYPLVNPFAFLPRIAPHIAAAQAQQEVNVKKLLSACEPALKSTVDYILIEGVGGWRVPINPNESIADFALALKLPVILVVGMRLGCLNHTLLTWETIQKDKVTVAGWIANIIDPSMEYKKDNINLLQQKISAPLLAVLDHNQSFAADFKL